MNLIRFFLITALLSMKLSLAADIAVNFYGFNKELTENQNNFLYDLMKNINITDINEEDILNKMDILNEIIINNETTDKFKMQSYKEKLKLAKLIDNLDLKLEILEAYLAKYGYLDKYQRYLYQEFCHYKQEKNIDKIQSECYKEASLIFKRYLENKNASKNYDYSFEYYKDKLDYFFVNYFASNKKNYTGLCLIIEDFNENKSNKAEAFLPLLFGILDWYESLNFIDDVDVELLTFCT